MDTLCLQCVFKYLCILMALGAVVYTAPSSGTTSKLREIFVGRCYDYAITGSLPSVQSNCTYLYSLFEEAFAYQPSCGLNSTRYDAFIQAASQELPADKSLFWSGTSNAAQELSADSKNYVTLENTLIGYVVGHLVWCGNATDGIDYDVCPGWNSCDAESSQSFWKAASRWFAKSAKGEVYVILKGTNTKRKAYAQDSFFAQTELPNMNASAVKTVNVILMQDLGQEKRETCTTGSLIDLSKDVKAKGIEFKCEENPLSLFHFICADDPNHKICQKPTNVAPGNQLHPWSIATFIVVFQCFAHIMNTVSFL